MAISRVGGTHGLLKGSVGNDTYLIVKSPNGDYTQVVQAKKTTHTDTKTVRLAVQQMCTAIVEAMMRDLKPIIKYSFQSAKNKTTSVNMFSQFALRSLANDCRSYWFQDGDFYYPDAGARTPVAGPFILSSGTLPYNCFSNYLLRNLFGGPYQEDITVDLLVNIEKFKIDREQTNILHQINPVYW